MEDFLNIIRREAERVADRRASGIRVGICSSYDPATHSVKLQLQPEGTNTGWMPLAAIGVGSGFGVYVGATTGHAYAAYFHEGDLEAGIIIGRLPTDAEAPVSVQAGEIVLQSPTGSLISLLQSGAVTIQDKGAATVVMDGSGNITLTGKAGQTIVMDSTGNIILTPAGAGFVKLGGSAAIQFVDVNVGGVATPATKVKGL